jgi:hypothetical protein
MVFERIWLPCVLVIGNGKALLFGESVLFYEKYPESFKLLLKE